MFLEMHKPKVVDLYQTTDCVKLRVAEPGQHNKYWLSLVFKDLAALRVFAEEINFVLTKVDPEFNVEKKD